MVEKEMETPIKSQKGTSICHTDTITETLLLYPNQLDKVKKSVGQELKKKIGHWDHERGGVLTKFTGKK